MRRLGLVVLLVSFGCAEDGGSLSDVAAERFSVVASLDFGQVALLGERTLSLEITPANAWRGELELRLPLNEAGVTRGFSVSQTTVQLDGEVQTVNVSFSPIDQALLQGVLPIACAGDECLAQVDLQGQGAELAIDSNVEFLDFGTVQNGCSRDLMAVFTNQSDIATDFELVSSTSQFTVSGAPETLGAKESVTLSVNFDGPIEDGDFTDVLMGRITADGQSEEVPVNLVGRTNPRGDTCN